MSVSFHLDFDVALKMGSAVPVRIDVAELAPAFEVDISSWPRALLASWLEGELLWTLLWCDITLWSTGNLLLLWLPELGAALPVALVFNVGLVPGVL